MEVLRGYLSLHQAGDNLTLKWTPNQLINGTLGDCDLEKSIYWDYALTVPLRQIVCIHCHQRPDCGGTLVLVSQDGIQRPPLHFPPGGHLLAFLSCLETGLLPRGQLEPPLWSQKGKGKVFPKLRKRSSAARLMEQDRNGEEQTAADYVFRIVYPGYRYDAITINYHHTTGSRAPSLDDDEEEEDRLHAMISMICSRNLTDPNVLKGFYHLNTPPNLLPHPHPLDLTQASDPSLPTSLVLRPPLRVLFRFPSFPYLASHPPQLCLPVCVLPEAEPSSEEKARSDQTIRDLGN
ncbi:PREDICTED: small G protein signaling modulator 2-like isoform X2 [Poecilia mexicana]|uniref:small G protein signaling modulator 2-like isoform X2 n=1 Tax=Poecilia mexicana TaxID=48701 RepID=UPI00072DBA9F|nr:PREDICTED: small G protein signaling modulator 2-like isoform X2 [Poecilia mexicana]